MFWLPSIQFAFQFSCSDMTGEAVIAKPWSQVACAIGSHLFPTSSTAGILLVCRYCSAVPAWIFEFFSMGKGCHQGMNGLFPNFSGLLLLLFNPWIINQLPCQSPTKNKKHWAPFNHSLCVIEVSHCQQSIDLTDSQNEREHLNLPQHCPPAIFNRWESMSEIVVIINRMSKLEVPINRTRVAEPACHLDPIFYPCSFGLLAIFITLQWPTAGHHFHDIVRLFHRPDIVVYSIQHPHKCIEITNLNSIPHKTKKSFWQIKCILQYQFNVTSIVLLYLMRTNLPVIIFNSVCLECI